MYSQLKNISHKLDSLSFNFDALLDPDLIDPLKILREYATETHGQLKKRLEEKCKVDPFTAQFLFMFPVGINGHVDNLLGKVSRVEMTRQADEFHMKNHHCGNLQTWWAYKKARLKHSGR